MYTMFFNNRTFTKNKDSEDECSSIDQIEESGPNAIWSHLPCLNLETTFLYTRHRRAVTLGICYVHTTCFAFNSDDYYVYKYEQGN